MRFFILAWMILSSTSFGFAQTGMLATDVERDSKAEQYLLEFIEAENPRVGCIAFVARSEYWESGSDEIVDSVYAKVEIPPKAFRYRFEANSVRSKLGKRFYRQTLEKGDWKLERFGTGRVGDEFADSRAVEGSGIIKETSSRPRYFDPHNLTVASFDNILANRVKRNFGATVYHENGRFVGSELDPSGRVVGVWQTYGEKGTIVEITFSKSPHHRPERTLMRRASGTHSMSDRGKRPIYSILETTWDEISGESSSVKRILPIETKMVALKLPGGSIPRYEFKMFYRWKIEEEAVWEPTDLKLVRDLFKTEYDWRDVVKERFEEDWSLGFRDAYDQWGKYSEFGSGTRKR